MTVPTPGPPVPPTPPIPVPPPRVIVKAEIVSVDLSALVTTCNVVFDDGSTGTIQWPVTITSATVVQAPVPAQPLPGIVTDLTPPGLLSGGQASGPPSPFGA